MYIFSTCSHHIVPLARTLRRSSYSREDAARRDDADGHRVHGPGHLPRRVVVRGQEAEDGPRHDGHHDHGYVRLTGEHIPMNSGGDFV